MTVKQYETEDGRIMIEIAPNVYVNRAWVLRNSTILDKKPVRK